MKLRQLTSIGTVTTLVASTLVLVLFVSAPSSALTGQFTWHGQTWCPNERNTFGNPPGCTTVQTDMTSTGNTATFDPAQTSITSKGYVNLLMNANLTKSGAFTTGGLETFSAPATISESINLPCSGSPAKVDNWPAFWMVTTGSWPANGEIDIMEGLHGIPAWHYHYANAAGQSSSAGGNYTNVTGCGTTTYKAIWRGGNAPTVTFFAAGKKEGEVSKTCSGQTAPCTAIGVNPATGPMYLNNDYATGTLEGGPNVGNVAMQVHGFSYTTP